MCLEFSADMCGETVAKKKVDIFRIILNYLVMYSSVRSVLYSHKAP